MQEKQDKTNRNRESTFAEYETQTRRYNRIRYLALSAYLIVVTVTSLLPLVYELDERVFLAFYLVFVMGGAVLLIAVVAYPWIRPLPAPEVEGLAELPSGRADLSRPWHETVHMKVFWAIFPLVLGFCVLMAILVPSEGSLQSLSLVVAIILVVYFLLGKLEVDCTPRTLRFKLGPIGPTIPLAEIESIRPTSVQPLKDFMGWGIRVGADGARGYIVAGTTGVRIQLMDGKQYVVTLPEPQSLVDYVRAAQA